MEYTIDTKEFRKAMIDKGINSLSDLSEKSKVSKTTISSILNGKTRPKAFTIEALAKALDLSGDDIGRIFFKKKLA